MRSTMHDEREVDRVASRWFTRWFLIALVLFGLIGLMAGLFWALVTVWQNSLRP